MSKDEVKKGINVKNSKMSKETMLGQATAFIVLLGIVSLFSDMTHEGAAGIRGAYLLLLGASASTIGFISGLGELLGFSLRYFFGRLTDKTHKYWLITIVGYAVDVFAVPLLALVPQNGWIFACALLILERVGKAIKKPAKNTILSFAASGEKAGRSFALQEALDQIGAFLGPVMLFLVMSLSHFELFAKYRLCYVVLAFPALMTMVFLLIAKHRFPHPELFEKETANPTTFKLKPSFCTYIAAISLFAFGFADFSLVTMHIVNHNIVPTNDLSLVYAGAMLVDCISALLFGYLYDKIGVIATAISAFICSFSALLIFGCHGFAPTALGVVLWGIGMGAQESVMKAFISIIVPKESRGRGYGIFEFAFGLSWFLGSWLLGNLYDISIPAFVAVSVLPQVAASVLFVFSEKLYLTDK